MLPIEVISSRDVFLLRARETFNILKFKSEKRLSVSDIEHGLNLDPGQKVNCNLYVSLKTPLVSIIIKLGYFLVVNVSARGQLLLLVWNCIVCCYRTEDGE